MKTSYNWLKKYVSIPWPAEQLAHELTMVGLEVEGISKVNDFPDSLVIANVLSCKKHPNAEKLSLCMVDDSRGDPFQVVCGASNCTEGIKVILAKVGTIMPGGDKIKKCKIRGEASSGMICSQRELLIGEDHDGICIIPPEVQTGTPLAEYLGVDTVIDWEVTPNRPDWLSHIGIAREISAVVNLPLQLPTFDLQESKDGKVDNFISVEVQDSDLCLRYTARVITGVQVGPSPEWMQKALRSVGLRPINNIVDITNFVLLECGQPLHAFDLHKLSGKKIIVRRAENGEAFEALDKSSHKLSQNHLVIADTDRAVALAGVIGGRNSEIDEETKDVLLESASFNPANVRSTSKEMGISTDSSYRFERGVDLEMVEFASARATGLICQYAGGKVAEGLVDIRQDSKEPSTVPCRFNRVRRLLGVDLDSSLIQSLLTRLGLTVTEKNEEKCVVIIPSFRLDLSREVDLIEEIVRLHGLDQIPAKQGSFRLDSGSIKDAYHSLQCVRQRLVSLGLCECLNNSLVGHKDEDESTDASLILLKNPLSADLTALRPGLLPGMLNTVAFNSARGNHDLRLFEIGRTFFAKGKSNREGLEACIVLSGRKFNDHYASEEFGVYDFFDLRGMLEDWLEAEKIENFAITRGENPLFKKGHCATLSIEDTLLGTFGEISPSLAEEHRVKYPLFMATVDLNKLMECSRKLNQFDPLPQYPEVSRDVAFSAEESLEHQQVVDTIRGVGIKFLRSIELGSIYRDDATIGKGKKSLAYTLTFRSPHKTLTDKEVNKAQEKIRLKLIDSLPIQIR